MLTMLQSANAFKPDGRSGTSRRKNWPSRSGISVVYLSKIENGRSISHLGNTLSNICTELDTELAEILTNTEIARKDYANDRVVELFNSCSMRVKPIALALLEDLSKL